MAKYVYPVSYTHLDVYKRQAGETPYVVGQIEDGEKGVTVC